MPNKSDKSDKSDKKNNAKHGGKTRGGLSFLVAALSVALAGAVGFRIFLSARDYLDYKKGLEFYSGFTMPDDGDFPDFDPAATEPAAISETSAPAQPVETQAETASTETAETQPADTAAETAERTEAATTAAKVYTFTDFVAQLKRLDERYEDFYCWIKIKNTTINYPVAQSGDNEYYLDHGISGNKLSVGSIFADYRCASIGEARSAVIYGHRVNYDIMFNALAKFMDADFFKSHPYIYIYTPSYTYVYEVYAAYKTSMYSDFNRVYFDDDESFIKHINTFYDGAEQKRSVTLTAADRILTLSTCTNTDQSERYVVQARRVSATAN